MSFSQKLYLGCPDYCQQKSFHFGYYVPCHVILECFPDFQKRQDCISHFSREPRYFLRGTLFKSYSWVLKCHFFGSSNWVSSSASLVFLVDTPSKYRLQHQKLPEFNSLPSHMQAIRKLYYIFKICFKFSFFFPSPSFSSFLSPLLSLPPSPPFLLPVL